MQANLIVSVYDFGQCPSFERQAHTKSIRVPEQVFIVLEVDWLDVVKQLVAVFDQKHRAVVFLKAVKRKQGVTRHCFSLNHSNGCC